MFRNKLIRMGRIRWEQIIWDNSNYEQFSTPYTHKPLLNDWRKIPKLFRVLSDGMSGRVYMDFFHFNERRLKNGSVLLSALFVFIAIDIMHSTAYVSSLWTDRPIARPFLWRHICVAVITFSNDMRVALNCLIIWKQKVIKSRRTSLLWTKSIRKFHCN